MLFRSRLQQQNRTINQILFHNFASQKEIDLLKQQNLILVDENDNQIGNISKYQAHSMDYINRTDSRPHRAFSIFMLNSRNQLLLHRRSSDKLLFPNQWTNSCCSHPLNTESERVQLNQKGIKTAIQNRLQHELGFTFNPQYDKLILMDKIIYKGQSCEKWGEYELDYVYFIKRDYQSNEFKVNKEEIAEYEWVDRFKIRQFLNDKIRKGEKTTPWMQIIMKQHFTNWISKLD